MIKSNFKVFFKRVIAYLIDMVIVFLLATIISNIPIFKTYKDKYNNLYDSFEKVLKEYTDVMTTLNTSFKDEEISYDEYDKLILFDGYKDYFVEIYNDELVSKEEYEEILSKINAQYLDEATNFEYNISKTTVSSSIITLVCLLGYFGGLQFLFKGQTIGKMLLKIRIVSLKTTRPNLIFYILRSLIVNNIFLSGVNILMLFLLKKDYYFDVANFLDFLVSVVEAMIIFLIITREDGRGLHDLICNTQVVLDEYSKSGQVVSRKKKVKKKIIEGEFAEK